MFSHAQALNHFLAMRSLEKRAAPDYDCGGIIDSPGEIIKSPNFPNNYDNNIECRWVIAFTHRDHIRLTFTEFELEAGTKMPFNPCP